MNDSDYRANRPHRDILEDLRQHGKFLEFFLTAWGIIEQKATEGVLMAFQMSSMDSRSELLFNLSIEEKLQFLKKIGCLSRDDYKAVNAFQKERNNLFHTGALYILHIDSSKKEEIMDIGMHAVDVMHDLREQISKKSSKGFLNTVSKWM